MSTDQDFTCVFCKESFEDKETLQEHFRKHGDPKFNHGKVKNRFQNEPSVDKSSEENEVVGCDVCDETFPSISKAITHKHKIHPDHDAKYFCPWCGKLFTMKHLYNKHMQLNHNDSPETGDGIFHCDCCNVDFLVASAMVYHNKFFHRQDSELPAIGQSKKVKLHSQEVLPIYYCPFCGEEYNNKVNLHKHMGDDHSDENQRPDEVLRCPICDAVFYHLDAYELHLSFHSSEDIYSDENNISQSIAEFSLECVPPVMEKVEEEIKTASDDGIENFLQLIMDESLESGNTESSDKPKSKKHKKHKKSKKSAITLDEFLNMNKDVFGDGLNVQGIEEVPTQHVLKKCKGKKEGRINATKPIPASAIAKLKKQGITIKSKSGICSPMLQASRELTINTLSEPNSLPIKVQEKPQAASTSNELLSKLLNQTSSQIKIVKKSTMENINKQLSPVPNSTNMFDNDDLPGHLIEEKTIEKNCATLEDTNNTQLANKDVDTEDSEHDMTNLDENKETTVENAQSIENDINTKILDDVDNKKGFQDPNMPKSPNVMRVVCQHKSDMNDQQVDTEEEVKEKESEIENGNDILQVHHDDLDGAEKQNSSEIETPNHKSLDALKHLSHLITVKQIPSLENTSSVDQEGNKIAENNREDSNSNKKPSNDTIIGKDLQDVTFKKPLPVNKPDISAKGTEVFKTLGRQLTIKPCSSSSAMVKSSDESDNDEEEFDDLDIQDNGNFHIETSQQNNVKYKLPALTTVPKDVKKPILLKNVSKEPTEEEDQAKKSFNVDILKRLTNVTAKPIGVSRNTNENISKLSPNSVGSKQFVQKIEKSKQIDEDIEIFNIDDSDDEDDQKIQNEEDTKKHIVNSPKCNERPSTASADVLKNLSKNITIKSTSQNKQPNLLNVKKEPDGGRPSLIKNMIGAGCDSKIKFQTSKQFNTNISHTLKKLGNNISIKSQFSTQKYQNEIEEERDDGHLYQQSDEESDSEVNNIKITELQDDEDNITSDTDTEYNGKVIVQSPQESDNENEDYTHDSHSDDDPTEDFESQIKMKVIQKENSNSRSLDAFKRNNKELTIKSVNDRSSEPFQDCSTSNKGIAGIAKNISKDVSIKQFRENVDKQDGTENYSKNVNIAGPSKQKAATTSNQVNKVNTVKTVKTFQSETIIEEITTTVTKTIRTVNQSSKQVAQKATVNNYKPINRPRMTLPPIQSKPVQGMIVRNAPTVGAKIRNAAPILRPTIALPVKQAGQLVPVRNQIIPRHGVTSFRPSAPSSVNIRKASPQSGIKKPVIGKPLKISPLAMNQTIKRHSEEAPGPFSCFKRPKDSMLDGLEDEIGEEGSMNFSSASSSRSEFSTTATKIVKGKSVVTATQARSEQHSEQHISKLSNMSGLKVVRSNAKQTTQVECKSEAGAAKRNNAMEALEKLQKQGLLIKKPRVDIPEDKLYNSNSDDEDSDEK